MNNIKWLCTSRNETRKLRVQLFSSIILEVISTLFSGMALGGGAEALRVCRYLYNFALSLELLYRSFTYENCILLLYLTFT